MKRPLLVAGLCLVVVGLGGIGVRHESKAELQRALASFRANLPPDARFEYDHAYPRFFARGAGFDNARFIRGETILSARVLTVNNPSGYLTTGLSFSKIHAEGITVDGVARGKIGDLTLSKLLLPPVSREKHNFNELPPLSQIHFRHGQIHDVVLGTADHCALHVASASLENYGHDDGNAGALQGAHFSCASDSLAAQKLHELTKLPSSELAFDLEDMHENGTRYARIVAWGEQLYQSWGAVQDKPLTPITDVSETPSRSESHGLAFNLLGAHARSEMNTARRWKDGDKIFVKSESRNVALGLTPSSVLAPFLPDGIHIESLVQDLTTDTKTSLSTIAFTGTTPGSFSFEWKMIMMNVENGGEPAVNSLDVTYHDDASNLDGLLTRIAAQRNQSLAQLKSTMALPLALLIQKVPGLNAVPAFMLAPSGHSLTISFHPPEPISAGSGKRLGPKFSADPSLVQLWASPPILSSSLN